MADDTTKSKEGEVRNVDSETSINNVNESACENTTGDQVNVAAAHIDHSDLPLNQATNSDARDQQGQEFKIPNFAVPSVPPPPSPSISLKLKARNEKSSLPNVTKSKTINKYSDLEEHATSPVEQKLDQHAGLGQVLAPYKEPEWGGETDQSEEYSFDVLKNGTIIGNIPLRGQSYFVFGRLQSCDVTLEHPSLSRYHAVIQHSKEVSHMYEKGWYIYDLDSTHGTWVNKRKLKPKQYYRLKVGYVIKFGGSSRLHILQGPDYDAEEESELSVTELKQQRDKQKREAELLRQNELQEAERQQEAAQKMLEDQGCSWGIGEDAVENEDENPFATVVPENEQLYVDDPKKALKGFYEREGCDLPDYQFTEMSVGKHKCRLELPVDGPNGEELIAEAVVSGKKKDAVIACALEACRILDRAGMLRPSQHESRKRKQKNWEADDFYDSDEDTFLDRTGTIEKKRFMRMKKAGKEEAETYESLMEKYTKITSQITEIEVRLEKAKAEAEALAKEEMDELDAYMISIKSGAMDTKTRMRLKAELLHLKMEEQHLSKLVNIAKPASMPPLKPRVSETSKSLDSFASRLQNKHLQRQKQRKAVPVPKEVTIDIKPDNFEEEDEDEENEMQQKKKSLESQPVIEADSSSNGIKNGSTTSDVTVDMKVTKEPLESLQLRDVKMSSKSDAKIPVSKGPHLPHSSTSHPSKPPKRSHQFSTVQALDTLDRPSNKKQSSSQLEQHDPTYEEWLPPEEQSGDGRTSLNDKLGY